MNKTLPGKIQFYSDYIKYGFKKDNCVCAVNYCLKNLYFYLFHLVSSYTIYQFGRAYGRHMISNVKSDAKPVENHWYNLF